MLNEFDDLLFCRGWQMSEGGCGITSLFHNDNHQKSRVVGGLGTEVEWKIPPEFVSTRQTEPLDHKHARRAAFGVQGAQLKEHDALRFPGRYLFSMLEGYQFYRVGNVRASWLLNGVFEVPRFCTRMASEGPMRLEYGFDPQTVGFLNAAKEIQPRKYDVIGIISDDLGLAGAFEFWEQKENNEFVGNLFYISNSERVLKRNEILIGKFSTMIGKTRIEATREIFKVVDVGDDSFIPPLEIA